MMLARVLFTVTVLLVLAGSAASLRAVSETGADDLVARIDAVWGRRNGRGAVPDMVALGTVVLAIDPQSYDAQWRMARAYFWVAYTHPNRLFKKALASKAIEWAERARTSKPDGVEGQYYYAVAVSQYAVTVGLMTAISDGVAKKIESASQRAYELDRDYEHGAPGTVLGRYYAMLPWPLRDLERSRRYLEEVVARHPGALIPRYFLAETYHELDEDDLARAQLDYVLAHEPQSGMELEQPDPKPLARAAMKDWFD